MWQYSGNPATSAKDTVRFLIGDTDGSDQLLLDSEIVWVLGQYNNSPINAAIRCCEAIIAKLSRLANESVGQVKIDFKDRCDGYRETQKMLITRLAKEDAAPYAGGISVSDKMTNSANTDLVRPDFKKHMMENQQIAPWTTNNQMWLWLNFED